MTDTALDHLSLSLPDWRDAVRGVRRWKPPRPKDLICAVICAVHMVVVVISVFQRDAAGLVFSAIHVAGWWRWAWRGIPAFWLPISNAETRLPDRLDWLWLAVIALDVVLAGLAIFAAS